MKYLKIPDNDACLDCSTNFTPVPIISKFEPGSGKVVPTTGILEFYLPILAF
jgi:hypothetical protein